MARVVYRVGPSGSIWTLKRDGVLQSNHNLKENAVQAGRSAARAEWEVYKNPSQLVIHRADGTIEDESTYGNDPYPPKG